MFKWFKERLQKRYWVRLVFKSGAMVETQFTTFKVVAGPGGRVGRITWSQNRFCRPTMLHIDVDAIDYVDGELVE